MTTSDFLTAVRSIADSRPVYREGGTGKDGTCDCIGLVMGALYALGRTGYDLHSSNYFARFQTDHLAPITSVSQLKAGMIVYKARSETAGLNPRYLSGGSCFNGDLLDYYHAGVVENTQSLAIVHCTSAGGANGIVRDAAVGGWTHCGHVKGLTDERQEPYTAVVAAVSGSTVNLRKRPAKSAPVIRRIPVGTTVSVHALDGGWAKVSAGGEDGYMMEAFLSRGGGEQPWVRMPRSALDEVLRLLGACIPDKEETE